MARNIVVTSALPYANGPIHIGHLVEYIQTDIWVRFHKAMGDNCLYFCADDTHGTAITIHARDEGISPEQLIARVHSEHKADFAKFFVQFENYHSTHSEENRLFCETIYNRLKQRGSIVTRDVEQSYCRRCNMFLPDRYIRGICPRCKAQNQYGDSCDSCGATYASTELLEPRCSICGETPGRKKTLHYFFRLPDYAGYLRELVNSGHTHKSVAAKLDEWFSAGLKDWDISRDGPYFGFKIPGEEDKYFYVWLDAPIGYMASCKNYCDRQGLEFDRIWNNPDWELYHFIGKDIMYFHALFWPAMLHGSGFRVADKLFVHGFLTVNGEKMSKSKGTFLKAETFAKYVDPEHLRYYYASKLSAGVDDIDLNLQDFIARVNSDLVGKLANIASRSAPMITAGFNGRLGMLDSGGRELLNELTAAKKQIIDDYEQLNYAAMIRKITALADIANRYVEQNQPWSMIKTDPPQAGKVLTATLNAVKVLTVYLKPVLPQYAQRIEKLLNVGPLMFGDIDTVLENHSINVFERLTERIDEKKVIAMLEENKIRQTAAQTQTASAAALDEPLSPECTIDDFAKIDLRVAKVIDAQTVAGANKLLKLELEIGPIKRTVFAGIAKAYQPQQLVGRLVICVANLKPRQMKFGLSEGMVCAAGPGGSEIFLLAVDSGAKPGQRIH